MADAEAPPGAGVPVEAVTPGGDDRPISRIVVLYAMDQEALPLVEHLQLQEDPPGQFPKGAPWVSYSGQHEGTEVTVVIPGKDKSMGVPNVGTVPAAILAYAAIEVFKPDLLINAGTAGGFKAKGAGIGDIYVATYAAYHDRRIPLPGFDVYGIGKKICTPTPQLVKALGLKEGSVSSGNSFDMTDKDLEYIKNNDATVKDMECAAIAWVAQTLSVAFVAIKSITDIVDGDRPTSEEFLENLGAAAASLQAVVPQVIGFVGGKRRNDL
eukprot:SM000096S24845  [mRNA]  locus=s96:53041:55110:+ [translate_table: standard]